MRLTGRKPKPLRAVLIFTERQELFFGYTKHDLADKDMLLERVRIVCRYKGTCGVLGLVAMGPGPECRISQQAPRMYVRTIEWAADIESVEAIAAWEVAPWGVDP